MSSDNLVGRTLGRYELREKVGMGGMGSVYRAYDARVAREVAVKVLSPALASGDNLARFQREARLVAQLEHPNIIPLYDFGEDQGLVYVVMRLLPSNSLESRLRAFRQNNRPLPSPGEVADFLDSIASALDYAHSRHIIHRDIKPSNIMFDLRGTPYIVDFGIARMVASQASNITAEGLTAGSPAYMSPEQWQGLEISPATDQYALGVIVYELLTGEQPYQGDTPYSLLLKHLNEQPAPVWKTRQDIPVAVDDVLMRAMAKKPDERYPNVTAFANAFREAVRGHEGESTEFFYFITEVAPLPTAVEQPQPVFGAVPAAPSLQPSAPPPQQAAPLSSVELNTPLSSAPRVSVNWLALAVVAVVILAAVIAVFALLASATGSVGSAILIMSVVAVVAGGGIMLYRRRADTTLDQRLGDAVSRDKYPIAPSPAEVDNRTMIDYSPPPVPTTTPTPASTYAGTPETTGIYVAGTGSAPSGQAAPGATGAAVPGVQLTVMTSGAASLIGRSVRVHKFPFVIGRSADVDLPLEGDTSASRRHAQLTFENGQFFVSDLNSSNGTFVNGKRVPSGASVPLMFGASIGFGKTSIRFMPVKLDMPDLTGKVLNDRYEVKDEIALTGKGAIYRGWDRSLKRDVAIKVLSPDLAAYPGYKEQLEREAQIAVNLDHPHIVRIFDCQTRGEYVYIVMKLLDGGALDKERVFTLDETAALLQSLASALDYAHGQGVIHSGLKLNSIMFDGQGNCHITDFAIAQTIGKADDSMLVGSPVFLAPEQWEGGEVTAKTDQYSLAVLAYLLVCGEYPFEGQTELDYRDKHLNKLAPPVHIKAIANDRPDVPPAVSNALQKALAKNPAERYDSAAQLADAFAAALKPQTAEKHQPTAFISYRRMPSAMLATLIATKLQLNGINVYVDTRKLDGGGPFPARLLEAIEQCDVFVCLVAESTFESEWVCREVDQAAKLGKTMIPVFQESYKPLKQGEMPTASIEALLRHDGVHVFDIKNVYIDEAIHNLTEMVKDTLNH